MPSISNLGIITVTQGDCFQAPLFLNIGSDNEPIRLDLIKFPDLEVYFGVYTCGSRFERSFIIKKFTYLDTNKFGDVVITLNPEDTKCVRPGKYKYSIKVRIDDPNQGEWVNTVIDSKDFYLI